VEKTIKTFLWFGIFFPIMCEHVHICSDIDSRQNMEKATRTLLWFTNEVFFFFFELPKI
jgi:hypothetical protein